MREMRWTWTDLEATPQEVRQYAWDVIVRERAIEANRARKAARARERQAGATAIEY